MSKFIFAFNTNCLAYGSHFIYHNCVLDIVSFKITKKEFNIISYTECLTKKNVGLKKNRVKS